MNKYITCYDVETTGLNPKEDFIIQLAMVKFEKDTFEQVKSANYYIKPAHKYNIDPKAQEVHGITKEFLEENGVFLKDIIEDIKDFFKDSDLLTYNGNNFDIKFFFRSCKIRIIIAYYRHLLICVTRCYHVQIFIIAFALHFVFKLVHLRE